MCLVIEKYYVLNIANDKNYVVTIKQKFIVFIIFTRIDL